MDFSNPRKTEATEAIEKLPEEVIHLILSFLEAQDAAKTTVLSRQWLRAWRTQPTVQCDENYFPCRKKFENYVNSSLLRYQEKKIIIEKFKVIFRRHPGSLDWYDWTLLLYIWIGIAIEIGLRKLELVDVPRPSSIPPIVFEAELLEDLFVSSVPFYMTHQFPETISCLRLKRLSFSTMSFEEGALEKILSICKCIEFLNLCQVYLDGEKLKVLAQNLKELHLLSCEFNTLEVEAPNLEVFTCSDCCVLYLKTTQNVKFLKLFRTYLYWVELFDCNQFPKLENLKIQDCPNLRDLKVTSQITLKKYVDSYNELEYIFVDSLNTTRFDFYSRNNFIPVASFRNLSTCSVSNIHLDVLDSRQFWKLKKLLRSLMSSRISLSINGIIDETTVAECFGFEKGYKLPIPVHELSLGPPSSAFGITWLASEFPSFLCLDISTTLDAIFWTCRPTLIRLGTSPSLYYCPDNDFVEFLVWKLMVQKDQDYHDSKEIKSWLRDLKEVKVDFYSRNDREEWKPVSWDWETFLNMISKVQVLICVTCDWLRSSYVQEAQ